MSKKAFIVLAGIISFNLVLSGGLMYAQNYSTQKTSPSTGVELVQINEKLNQILSIRSKKDNNKAIINRLDRILENQAQISRDLQVIKVRASR